MLFEEITLHDLNKIKELQPEGWSDIGNEFIQYIEKDYCYPIKVSIDGVIVGIGTSIVFDKTAWLAHIIVKSEYRNRGIGYEIVKVLIAELKTKQVETYLLIATEMGEPVYKKFGFKTISNYLFLSRDQAADNSVVISDNIVPYEDIFFDDVINLDKLISGENREQLLKNNLGNALVYIEKNRVHGAYLPRLGEGLIIADIPAAGIELMNIKYSEVDKAVIPAENEIGITHLLKNGFKLSEKKGRKMILGKELLWKPDCYFSRIGGNYG